MKCREKFHLSAYYPAYFSSNIAENTGTKSRFGGGLGVKNGLKNGKKCRRPLFKGIKDGNISNESVKKDLQF
jgi:hypothetical protein